MVNIMHLHIFYFFRIIKSASKFNQESSVYWNADISKKRVGYVYCVVQLLCQCSYQEDISEEAFSNTILNLLTEIETIEISGKIRSC